MTDIGLANDYLVQVAAGLTVVFVSWLSIQAYRLFWTPRRQGSVVIQEKLRTDPVFRTAYIGQAVANVLFGFCSMVAAFIALMLVEMKQRIAFGLVMLASGDSKSSILRAFKTNEWVVNGMLVISIVGIVLVFLGFYQMVVMSKSGKNGRA